MVPAPFPGHADLGGLSALPHCGRDAEPPERPRAPPIQCRPGVALHLRLAAGRHALDDGRACLHRTPRGHLCPGHRYPRLPGTLHRGGWRPARSCRVLHPQCHWVRVHPSAGFPARRIGTPRPGGLRPGAGVPGAVARGDADLPRSDQRDIPGVRPPRDGSGGTVGNIPLDLHHRHHGRLGDSTLVPDQELLGRRRGHRRTARSGLSAAHSTGPGARRDRRDGRVVRAPHPVQPVLLRPSAGAAPTESQPRSAGNQGHVRSHLRP